jgi:hypothetical protein
VHRVIDGFSRAEPDERPGHTENRDMLGFKDGTANLDMNEGTDATDFVWVGTDRNGGVEPSWTVGGSYQAVRLIRTLVERWDRASLTEQEQFIGREKFHGAPLGKTDEADDPDFADDPTGERIPLDAHIRLARPRTKETEHQRILRKGFNYAHGFDAAGTVDQGLVSSATRRRSTPSSPCRSASRVSRWRSTRCRSAAGSSSPCPVSATPTTTWVARCSAECRAQPLRVDAPVVVLSAVDERDRDLFGVLLHQLGVGRDVDLVVRLTRFGAHRFDDGACVVAEVAAGLGEQPDTRTHARPIALRA